ncbi:hypothetical protein ABZ519_41935 [Streptomyces collinus]
MVSVCRRCGSGDAQLRHALIRLLHFARRHHDHLAIAIEDLDFTAVGVAVEDALAHPTWAMATTQPRGDRQARPGAPDPASDGTAPCSPE